MRPLKLTAQQWAVLEREAELRLPITRNKVLAPQLGVSELYISRAINRLMREKRRKAYGLTQVLSIHEHD